MITASNSNIRGLYPVSDQLIMAGARKFSLKHIARDDIASLTRECTEISGIPYITEVDKAKVEEILNI